MISCENMSIFYSFDHSKARFENVQQQHNTNNKLNKTEVTSVKLVVFKWEKLFDILTLAPAGKLARGVLEIGLLAEIRKK